MSDAKKEFAKRLKEAMAKMGYPSKPAVLEREFNLRYMGAPVTLHGVRRWLLGETLPAHDKILVLASWLNIEPHVLRDGAEPAKGVKTQQKRWEDAIQHHERETFEAFLKLPTSQKKIVREVILAFAKGTK